MSTQKPEPKHIAVIGGGPAGLMAAETIAAEGIAVSVFEKMPTLGRKFLMAGRGGLNLSHIEGQAPFMARYGEAKGWMAPRLAMFTPGRLREWCEDLGQRTFVGSSGRIFPTCMKASPLLRAWRARLDEQDVQIYLRHTWHGWDEAGSLCFTRDNGEELKIEADAVVLALGGASWPKLGADAAWVDAMETSGVEVKPFQPSNCGVNIAWSAVFKERFAGTPLKGIALGFGDKKVKGEAMITDYGLEGGALYSLSPALRASLAGSEPTTLTIDLRPEQKQDVIAARLAKVRKGESLSNRLKKALKLSPAAISLLREAPGDMPHDAGELAALIKSVPVTIDSQRPLDRAISSAGGVALDAMDENQMLLARPGVFLAGEMLDWEAPTGGYLLQGCFSSGVGAANGVIEWISEDVSEEDH